MPKIIRRAPETGKVSGHPGRKSTGNLAERSDFVQSHFFCSVIYFCALGRITLTFHAAASVPWRG